MTTAESVSKDLQSCRDALARIEKLASRLNVHDAARVSGLKSKAEEYAKALENLYPDEE